MSVMLFRSKKRPWRFAAPSSPVKSSTPRSAASRLGNMKRILERKAYRSHWTTRRSPASDISRSSANSVNSTSTPRSRSAGTCVSRELGPRKFPLRSTESPASRPSFSTSGAMSEIALSRRLRIVRKVRPASGDTPETPLCPSSSRVNAVRPASGETSAIAFICRSRTVKWSKSAKGDTSEILLCPRPSHVNAMRPASGETSSIALT